MKIGKNTKFQQRMNEAMKRKKMRNADIIEASRIYGNELSSSSVAQYRTGLYVPKKEKLAVLASILDVSENWLLGIDEDIKNDNITIDEMNLLNCYRKLPNESKVVIQSLIKLLNNIE